MEKKMKQASTPLPPPEFAYETVASACPIKTLARFRREAPVAKLTSPIRNQVGYLVTRTADVLGVARDPMTFSSTGNPQSKRWGDYNEEVAAIFHAEGWPLVPVLVWIDPPSHARYRKLVDRIFTPARVSAREEHIRICIDKLVTAFASGGQIDAVGDFAAKLPAMVMTREFGAHEDDFALLIETANAIGHSIDFTKDDPADADHLVAQAAHAIARFQHYMAPRIENVRHQPSNTMLSELVNAREGDEPALTVDEIMSVLVVFLIAATHSTTGMIGWALYCLAEQQDLQERLRQNSDLIQNYVEEVLRLHGTVSTSFRTATSATKIGGYDIPSGAQIFLRWDSANQDEAKWPQSEAFDLNRQGVRNHVAFGAGIHFCVGSTLARKEIAMSVQKFLTQFKSIAFSGQPQELNSFNIHALINLPLSLAI